MMKEMCKKENKKVVVLCGEQSAAAVETLQKMEQTVFDALGNLGYIPSVVKVTPALGRVLESIKKIEPLFVFNGAATSNGNYATLAAVVDLLEKNGILYTGEAGDVLYRIHRHASRLRFMRSGGYEVMVNEEDAGAGSLQSETMGGYTLPIKGFFAMLASNGKPEIFRPAINNAGVTPQIKMTYCALVPHNERSTLTDAENEYMLLVNRLTAVGVHCWNYFSLRYNALIDFHIDKNGTIAVIDVDASPDLSLESAFISNVTAAGYTYEGVIIRLIDEAFFIRRQRGLTEVATTYEAANRHR